MNATCPSCGREVASDFRVCPYCTAPLAETPIAREERKVVTVLFADLVGFTSRAERMDPEEVRALQTPYFARVRAEIERFGGTVEKFIGDAVMALFGAPVAHEDDPERGVRAALAIRDWIAEEQPELQVRLACTTGEALISLGARPSEGEGMASGDVVNTAARLQSAAPPNGLLVDATTYRATERAIDYQEHAAVEAKGKSDRVPVWEAVQARARYGTDVRQIGRTPLFGRTRELDVLVDALTRVREERQPQLATLVGVPGIGKSRLVWELFQRADAMPGLTRWRQGRSLPYGEGVSFWALGEMVKAEAGILETDEPEQAAAKLARAVQSLSVDEDEWVERHLRPLVGLEAEVEVGGDRRGEAFAAWRRFVEALADHRPTVLVFEDLHWADEGLLDFVDHVVDWVRGVPLLVIGTARPELLARRPDWGGGKPNALTLSLSALSTDDTARLVHALLDRSVLSADIQASLLERAEGNPLYAEEFVRLLDERPGTSTLPESVQGIIAARLDALTIEEKNVVQDAAVYGKVFWLGGLVAGRTRWSVEQLLHSLERKEFVRRERRSSVAGETEFAFHHALVREVAYDQIPRGRRAEKHVAAAEWIESLGRPDDHAEMLAHHYLSALDLAGATGADTSAIAEPARRALRDAGDRATALNAHAGAARFYRAALGLWSEQDPEHAILLLRLGDAARITGDDERVSILERASRALLAHGLRAAAAEAEALLAEVWWFADDGNRSRFHLRRAEELARDGPASREKARVLSQLARYKSLGGEPDAAIRDAAAALAIAKELELLEIQAHALNNLAVAYGKKGDGQWRETIERSIELARSINSPELARSLNNYASLLTNAGEVREGRELFAEAAHVARELGNLSVHRFATEQVASFYLADGEWDLRLEHLEAALSQRSHHGQVWWPFVDRGLIRLARDDRAGALADVEASLLGLRESGMRDPQAVAPTLSDAVFILVRAGEPKRAVDVARTLEPELEHEEVRSHVWMTMAAAMVADEVGLRDALTRLLDRSPTEGTWREAYAAVLERRWIDAAEVFTKVGSGFYESLSRLAAAEELVRAGRRAEANAQLAQALAFFRKAKATRYIREAELLLAASA